MGPYLDVHATYGSHERTTAAGLVRSGPSEVAAARSHLRDVIVAARRLAPFTIPVATRTLAGDPCPAAGCALASTPDGADLCRLTQTLAAIRLEAPLPRPTPFVADAVPLLVELRITLRDALDAIRTCRQLLHPSGMCWFAGPDGAHGCGEVLQVAHRCGIDR